MFRNELNEKACLVTTKHNDRNMWQEQPTINTFTSCVECSGISF